MTEASLRVFDDFLPDPEAYRAAALALEYRSYDFPDHGETYHGIATPAPPDLPLKLAGMFPGAVPTMSFFRKSPEGQEEPQYIHTDIGMGEWTALLYLNPDPPEGDGTVFWEHRLTGAIRSPVPHDRSVEGRDPSLWRRWRLVQARFNRLLLFPATFFHSRAIPENWGAGDGARLIQVVFGKGAL